jgi:hypothetical protein
MRRETGIQLLAFTAMLAFLAASGALATRIAGSAGKNKLVYADKAEAGDPPQVALGIAMGAFRGLFVNYLWIRANDLKQDGKFYEAVDLAKTITKLQPRFPKVWQFHAWNLAYNISVSTNTPQERWNWVQAGVRLLRNEGIPNCPNDLGIHRELAWIHLHKIQGYMDDAHRYYKKQFALEWTFVVGSPPQFKLEDMGTGKLKDAYLKRWIGPIADAPDTEEELLSPKPRNGESPEQAAKRAAEIANLISAIKREAGLDLDLNFLRQFEIIDAAARGALATGIVPPRLQDDPLARLIADKRFGRESGMAVVNYTKKKVLVHDYHMDPDAMVRYTQTYGPLDWRHPAAHAIYWSHRGVEETLRRVNEQNLQNFDVLNTDRLTIQALQELFRSGDLTFDVLNPDFYLALPNTEFIDSYGQALADMIARSKYEKDHSKPYRFFMAGYTNFMLDAIRYLYRRGDRDAAADYLAKLRSNKELNINDMGMFERLKYNIDDFIVHEIQDDSREDSPVVAMQEVTGSLYAAYVGGLLRGDTKRFTDGFNYARLFHENYQQSRAFKTWITGKDGRMGFPPFENWAADIFAQLIQNAGPYSGSTMYRRAPADLQAGTYAFLERTRLKAGIDAAEKQGNPAFDVWFPPPPPAVLEVYRTKMFPPTQDPTKGRTELK